MKKIVIEMFICQLCSYSVPAKGEEDCRPVCPACGHSTNRDIPSRHTKWVVQRVRTYLEERESNGKF